MSTVIVDVSELQSFDGASVKELGDFLKERLETNLVVSKKEITIEFEEGKESSRSNLRLLLRNFYIEQI